VTAPSWPNPPSKERGGGAGNGLESIDVEPTTPRRNVDDLLASKAGKPAELCCDGDGDAFPYRRETFHILLSKGLYPPPAADEVCYAIKFSHASSWVIDYFYFQENNIMLYL
jgi:hypothetical protein